MQNSIDLSPNYEQQKEELEGLLSDQRLPKGMRKFLNVANIIWTKQNLTIFYVQNLF